MNHTDLKTYAPHARRDFIQAVTDRAAFYGVTATKIEPVTEKGDVAIIAGHAFPASVVAKRRKLVDRVGRDGFDQTMEALAYTWFNRLVAIRFMELHGYLEHGYRVLSHPDPSKTIPEILELAEHADLPGLCKEKVIDLKLDVNKESELYRMLLLAQCHGLHAAMPFLFEGIDDETELVLPENLLHSDSLIRKLVAASAPEDWQEVEVLGWLYQFYISERKDEVMARKSAVPTQDIPAVTQLFTPHWIVRYLIENSLGRLWLLNHPGSKLREHMLYYIEGDTEIDFLKITKPEEIRLLDPACGSGHMLTYAFDLLFLIYQEEGYIPDEIPALILKHNLYGLEICPRAAQLANLALVLKARGKSPRFIQPGKLVQPRIHALQNVRFGDSELRDYISALDLGDLFNEPMLRLLYQFEQSTTLGSLIQPCLGEGSIPYARHATETKDLGSQLFLRETHLKVLRVLEQAQTLTQRYHVVAANPPYMGSGAMNSRLKSFLDTYYENGRTDLYAAFILRNLAFADEHGYVGMITIPNWMFLPSFESLRAHLLAESYLSSMVHNGRGVWGGDFGSCSFTIAKSDANGRDGIFRRLFKKQGEIQSNEELKANFANVDAYPPYKACSLDFARIPGSPIAYWASKATLRAFEFRDKLASRCFSDGPCKTGCDAQYLRFHWEVSRDKVGNNSEWCLCSKGGAHRKFYGNVEHVIRWSPDARNHYKTDKIARITPDYLWGRQGITWTIVSAKAETSFRVLEGNVRFNSVSPSIFLRTEDSDEYYSILSLLNSTVANHLLSFLNPTLALNVGNVLNLPNCSNQIPDGTMGRQLSELAKADWDTFETSWDFHDQPLLRPGVKGETLQISWRNWEARCLAVIYRMQELETDNNRLWIDVYGLTGELKPEVPEEQITLAHADQRRDIATFLSYAIGCIMGRYSLDRSGFILADAGDSLDKYQAKVGQPLDQLRFQPAADGIVPMLDGEWFENDIMARIPVFLRATFGEATLEGNLRFIQESLGKGLHKYFLADFFKDHLQAYKKRPIYWLFSSGKERAFQALVYLHRYHEGTLSRMRTEYVIPLQGKIASRIDQLEDDIQKATSTSHRKKMQKERDILLKQRTELQIFDEKLRHYADQRINLNLDDGVKVNYGKFGDLLAEVKAVTGGSDE